jgi:hypothetical protein
MVVKRRQLGRFLDGGGKRVAEGKGGYVAYLDGGYVTDARLQRWSERTRVATATDLGKQLSHAVKTSFHQHVSH